MARRLPDGSIQMADGRIIYGDTFLQTQDFIELLPLFSTASAWPFVSGGGGSGDNGGFVPSGSFAAALARGLQGFQGTNPGIQGPQGNVGPQGRQGAQGQSGPQGVTGIQGPQGLLGTQGAQGNQGAFGPQGLQGLQGNQGRQGAQGLTGLQGNQGLIGTQGAQGPQGNQGNQGFTGVQGNQGVQGIQGIQGLQGTNPGVQGPQGFQGFAGTQGFQGTIGFQGTTSNSVNLQFGVNNSIGGASLQLEGPGTALVGVTIVRPGTITGGSITVNSASGNNYNLDIRINGVSVATVTLVAGNTSAFNAALAAPVVAGDILTVFMVRITGSGGSGFSNQQALVEITS